MKYILLICFLGILTTCFAQNEEQRLQILEKRLEQFAKKNPSINEPVEVAITASLQEIVQTIALSTDLNLTVDAKIKNQVITSSFSNATAKSILLYFCKEYELTLEFTGNIITLKPYKTPPPDAPIKQRLVEYNSFNNLLTVDVKDDTLDRVVKAIVEVTNKNIVPSSDIGNQIITSYIKDAEFDIAMELFAKRNNLLFSENEKGYYELVSNKPQAKNKKSQSTTAKNNKSNRTNTNQPRNRLPNVQISSRIDTNNNTLLTLVANDVGISELIKEVSIELGYNYFLFAEPQGKTSLKLVEASYDDFLFHILRGSEFTFEKDKDVYIIGERKLEGLRTSKVIQLKHRSVKDIETFIPADFVEGVEIKPFIELNALIVSGSDLSIREIETFLNDIDRAVPVVTIELIILDVQYNRLTELGVEAGVADEPVTSSGKVYPDVDFQFGGGAVNNLLALLENQGTVNLGRVQPNFYVNLKAVEDQGYVRVRSKPRLSTLNGQKATLTIGETRYYRIQQSNFQGTNNPITVQSERFEAAEANFSIEIEPFISGDEQVTLGILVDQSDFIGQSSIDAPPSTVSRKFESNIRIKNEEMIVLGGLETKGYQDTGTGLPLLARIPIIKWFFSKRTQGRDRSKLLIFVKPTVIY